MTLKSIDFTEKGTGIAIPDEMGQIMESVIACGDLSQLGPRERTRYYGEVCKSIGLNPMTRPFDYITLNGRLTLYARKDATDQLRSIYDVSVLEMTETERDGLMIVTVKVQNGNGRTDVAKGAVTLASLKGDALANAIMKCETKAKRRATLSICGLGFLDETEIETIPASALAQSGGETVLQGSPEWLQMRLGKVTASRIADMTARAKNGSGWLKPRGDYMMELVSERLTGQPTDFYVSPAMQWGTAQEPAARQAYSRATGREISSLAFLDHPRIQMSGASPDGLVGTDGLVEIKCPNTVNHLALLESKTVPADYLKQIMWQLACTERQWCDFVSFDPRVPDASRLMVVRVTRDDKMIAELESQVVAFLAEVDAKVKGLTPPPQQDRLVLIEEINALLAKHGLVNGEGRTSLLMRHFGASSKPAFEERLSMFDLKAGYDSLHQELEGTPSRYGAPRIEVPDVMVDTSGPVGDGALLKPVRAVMVQIEDKEVRSNIPIGAGDWIEQFSDYGGNR